MCIQCAESNLFRDWKKQWEERGDGDKVKDFIYDGVICPEEFENAICKSTGEKLRITFVLKDPNNLGEEYQNDMRHWIRQDGASGGKASWDNIIRWTRAILDNGCDYPEHLSSDDYFEWPKKISFMNVKKLNGIGKIPDKVIREYGERDAALILKQLEIYTPDIIVACGGYIPWLLWEVILPRTTTDIYDPSKDRRGYCFKTRLPSKSTDMTVICWRHPARTFGKDRELFNEISEIAKTLLTDR